MKLLSSLICEESSLSLNDLTMLQRLMLKKVYTGKVDPFRDNLKNSQLDVLDSLTNLGLLDAAYEITEQGAKAAKLIDSYSKDQRDDLSTAKELVAAELRDKKFDDDYSDEIENFHFTENEEIAMKAAGLDPKEVARILVSEGEGGWDPDKIVNDYLESLDLDIPRAFEYQINDARRELLSRYVGEDRLVHSLYDAFERAIDRIYDEFDAKAEAEGEGYVDDYSDDGDALASAGWGTDEDYGYFGDDY